MLALLLGTLALPSAQAQDYVVQVGDPQIWEQGGVWARPMYTDDHGWKLFLAAQNDYWVADLDEGEAWGEWDLDRDSKVNLTNLGNLQDNAVAKCPDGSFLIASSASLTDPNDTSYWTWVSADFEVLNQGVVEQESNERAHNDLVSVCNPVATGVMHAEFGNPSEDFESTLFHVDPTTGVTGTSLLQNIKAEGGAVTYDSRTNGLVASHASLQFQGKMSVFDEDLALVEATDVTFVTGDWKETWPQGLVRVGDFWLVATLARDETVYGMGEFGDIFVIVMDDDFSVLERHQVTTFLDDGTNANRPWLARKDGQVLVGFDRENRHGVVELELDLAAFGVEPGEDDGGGDDGWTGGDSDGGGSDGGGSDGGGSAGDEGGGDGGEGSGGCGGCAAASSKLAPSSGVPGGAALGLLGLLGLVRRRRA